MPFESPLNKTHLTSILCAAGVAAVGFFDFMVFAYLSDTFSAQFFSEPQSDWLYAIYTIALFAMSYLAAPVGAWLAGWYGDAHGRRSALYISLASIAVCTLLMAILPTKAQIGTLATVLFILARLGQSMAFGGILPAAWVLTTESLPTSRIGTGCGVVMGGVVSSLLLLNIALTVLDYTLSFAQMIDFGWRVLLGFGSLMSAICLLGFFITQESSVFVQSRRTPNTPHTSKIKAISLNDPAPRTNAHTQMPKQTNLVHRMAGRLRLNFSLLRSFRSNFFMAAIFSFIIASLLLLVPIFLLPLIELGFDLYGATQRSVSFVGILFMIIGCVLFGFLADMINTGRLLAIAGFALFLQAIALFFHMRHDGQFILLFFTTIGFSAGLIGALPPVLVRLFNTRSRLLATGVAFNSVLAVLGGALPFLLGYAAYYLPYVPMLYLMLIGLVAIFASFYIYYLPREEGDLGR